jgi:hypothetical protein
MTVPRSARSTSIARQKSSPADPPGRGASGLQYARSAWQGEAAPKDRAHQAQAQAVQTWVVIHDGAKATEQTPPRIVESPARIAQHEPRSASWCDYGLGSGTNNFSIQAALKTTNQHQAIVGERRSGDRCIAWRMSCISVISSRPQIGIRHAFHCRESVTSPPRRAVKLRVPPVVGEGTPVSAHNMDGASRP